MTPELRAQVLLGKDAEDFVESELGRVVLGMAKQDLEAAVLAFDNADINNPSKLLDLKVDLRVARRFEQYLIELINRGREAWDARDKQGE